jgi:hypothetical protein
MNPDITSAKLLCTTQKDNNVIRITPFPSSGVTGREEKECKEEKQIGRWTRREHKAFIKGRSYAHIGLKKYGKKWKELQKCIPTRTVIQIRTHAQKFFIKLEQLLPQGTDLIKYLRNTPLKSFIDIIKDFNEANSKSISSSFSSSSSGIVLCYSLVNSEENKEEGEAENYKGFPFCYLIELSAGHFIKEFELSSTKKVIHIPDKTATNTNPSIRKKYQEENMIWEENNVTLG